ncbi:UNVERIFIED_ORG: hypothetical protein GGE64_006143 [Rhizobium etli]
MRCAGASRRSTGGRYNKTFAGVRCLAAAQSRRKIRLAPQPVTTASSTATQP